jgi:phage baseplate assembly protein W
MGFQASKVENFLGNGITLPLRLVNGAAPLDTGVDLIKASIRFLLSWTFGTRFFLAEYGSRLEDLLEEPNDDVLNHLVYTMVSEAIAKWETRVTVLDTNISRDDLGKTDISVYYQIITSQKTDTLVFPFYNTITT